MELKSKTMEEIWKDISGYEGLYQISNLGRVKSLDRKVPHKRYSIQMRKGCILKFSCNHQGYYTVKLNSNNKSKSYRVNKLVYETFVGKVKNGYVVDHIDNEQRQNNSLTNLQEITFRMNVSKDTKNNLTGAYYRKDRGYWYSRININKKDVYLGKFDTEEQAHQAYINKLKEIEHK